MKWQKGQTGNPNGRPSTGRALSEMLRKALAKKGPDGLTHRAAVVNQLIALARAGDLDAIKVIFDRTDGKAAESIVLSSDPERPVIVKRLVAEIPRRDADAGD